MVFHPRGPTLRELTRQALSSTRRGYDLLAPKFDWSPFRTPEFILQAVADRLGPERIAADGLDLCCGTGAAVPLLRQICRRRVVGVDFSHGMLEVARDSLAPDAESPDVQWVEGDALALPFHEAFDIAVSFGSLGHFDEPEQPRFLAEVWRALRPGGRFVFVTGGRPPLTAPGYWLARGFNACMRVRNALVRPPFIMYYLTFLLPEVQGLLEAQGFQVKVYDQVLPDPMAELRMVVARRLA